ncbi:molybdopterin cofactor-binding domain-containing protein [Streptosporangium sp. NPDC004379]|uniref:xanthine dehydrogenase family protein molybdopterin-binding subunit n=1 Tax=Streptosporangium sp. NPDC004379 TaxID=3366189 RepID=UPI00368AD488
MDRRGFLSALGGAALLVVVPLPERAGSGPAPAAPAPGEPPAPFEPGVFVRVTAEGEITVTVPRPDSGQGLRTVAAMLVAEELRVAVETVRVRQAPGDTERYGPQMVANSTSVRQMTEPLRTASATARCLLVAAAAARWGVPAQQCEARDGHVRHRRHGRLSYGELVAEAAAIDPATVTVTPVPREDWRVVGRPVPRVDARDIVTGRARYGIDVVRPDGLVAVVRRPPWLGASVSALDDAAARAVPGVVTVVRLEPAGGTAGGVAVVARTTAAALRGRDALAVTWAGGSPQADSRLWLDGLEAALPPAGPSPAPVTAEATYRLPLLAHAPMEPMNATAHLTAEGRLSVWTPTQDPGGLRARLAQILRLDPGAVTVETTLAGGAFGRRIEFDFVLEAVACSRAAGAPVKVVWTREDDMRHDSYRPMSAHRLTAVTDASGRPTWRSHSVATWPLTTVPIFNDPALVLASGDHFPYEVPGKVDVALSPAPLRTGFWRSVYAGPFVYAEECFLSALAGRAGADPVEFRRRLLPEGSRLRRVLDAAASRAGRPLRGRGRGRGAACHLDYDSAIAIVADVREHGGGLTVERVTAAVDVGTALNPSGVRAQVEGGVCDAISTVLGARVTVRDGRVTQSSFADYPWARIGQVPRIDVTVLPSSAPPGGLGELAYPPASAAVASAVAAATGRPVTGMPVTGDVG